MACNPISMFFVLPGCSRHILSPFLFFSYLCLILALRHSLHPLTNFSFFFIFSYVVTLKWHLAGSLFVILHIHIHDTEPGVSFPFFSRGYDLSQASSSLPGLPPCLKFFFFDSRVSLLWLPNPSFCCLFYFLFVMLSDFQSWISCPRHQSCV